MRPRSWLVALPAAVLVLGLPAPAPVSGAVSQSEAVRPARVGLPTLTAVKAKHLGDVDRVTYHFENGLPQDFRINWVDTMHHDGSGLPVRVAGTKVLMMVFYGAVAHDQEGSTVRARTAFALPNVITAVAGGDFEGQVTFGLGVQQRTSFTVAMVHNPDRVVVDVDASFPTSSRKVWLVDRNALVVPVQRPVPAATPAAAVLHSLFAGPTPAERARGLRVVRSRAWGFDRLGIAGGIARVALTRGCDSGGSTVTVANEIVPSLKQFPSVDRVKIYSPSGQTESPTGASDSIPLCLEP